MPFQFHGGSDPAEMSVRMMTAGGSFGLSFHRQSLRKLADLPEQSSGKMGRGRGWGRRGPRLGCGEAPNTPPQGMWCTGWGDVRPFVRLSEPWQHEMAMSLGVPWHLVYDCMRHGGDKLLGGAQEWKNWFLRNLPSCGAWTAREVI